MSKKTIVDFGKNMDLNGNTFISVKDRANFMAGILNNQTGGLLGGALAAQQAQNNHVNQVNQLWNSAAQQQAFDPSGYLIGADPAAPGTDVTVVTNQSDAQRVYSQLLAYRATWADTDKSVSAVPTPPSVETVERLPRVIELESEDE